MKNDLVETKKFHCLDDLNRKMKKIELVSTYTLARKLELKNIEGPNEILFKIYAHMFS
jgi:hypothetical protein